MNCIQALECTLGTESIPMEVVEEEEPAVATEKHIRYESLKLRNQFKKEEIFHAFKELIHERSIQILKYLT